MNSSTNLFFFLELLICSLNSKSALAIKTKIDMPLIVQFLIPFDQIHIGIIVSKLSTTNSNLVSYNTNN